MDIGVVGRLLSCSELCKPGEEHRGWSCDHISLDGDRDTGDWEGSGKHLIGRIDISLLFLTWIQDGCRMGAGFDQDLWVELSEHFFLAPFFSVLVLMSWHWACTHLWTLWLCDLMWVSAVLVSQCLHGGQWSGCREQKDQIGGVMWLQGEMDVSDCLSNNVFGMKSALCSYTLPSGGNTFFICPSSGKSMATWNFSSEL